MALTLNFPWIEVVMLASVRMTTFLVIAPPLSTNAFSLRIKAMLIIGGLARSFGALPVAGRLDLAAPIHAISIAVRQMLLSALQIAGPLIVVLFLADAGLGLLTRVAPALNAFALGFPLEIFITLALGVFVFAALPQIVAAITGQAVSIFTGVR